MPLHDDSDSGRRVFSAYLRLWSAANLLRISIGFNAGTGLVGSTLDMNTFSLSLLPALVVLAGVMPSSCSGVLPFAAMTVRAATNLMKGSMMSNSQMWATQMDAAIMIAMASHLFAVPSSRSASWRVALSVDDERAIIGLASKTIRWQLAIFYFASGWWKLNTSWLHPDYSCGSLFTVQPLEYLPDNVLFASDGSTLAMAVPAIARTIALTGPTFTLILEAVVPALHVFDPRSWPALSLLGVAATLVFHMVIALTPPPSNVSTYGVTTCTRLFFMLPDAVAAALAELTALKRNGAILAATMAAVAAGSLALVAPLHAAAPSTVQGVGTDWHCGYYMALVVLFARASYLEWRGVHKPPPEHALREAPVSTRQITVSLVYAFLLPVLGLQEKSGCLMFSQLRLHGGSNHLVLPTSLLQRVFIDARADHAFAGGVVRVEETNLEWVGNTFAEHMGERTQRLVREVAKVPAQYVWAAKATSQPRSVPPPRFMRHTLSNLGLRQLLQTASNQRDDFWLRFTRLEGAEGDEAWRTSSGGVEYVVHGRDGEIRCARRGAFGTQQPCDEREARLLAKPDRLTSALAYFLIPQPNPIVPGYTEEMHCVTWG